MNSSIRTVVVPAVTALLVLGGSACAAPASAPHSAASATAAPSTFASTPAPASATTPPRTGSGSLVVTAAQPGAQQVAISTPGQDGPALSPAAQGVQLVSYDPGAGTAVLATAPTTTTPTATPTNTPSPSASAGVVRAGQLIASPPTAAAPQGALIAVTEVRPGGGDKVSVSTRPATLSELLGGTEADGKVAVDPHAIKVTPLVKDLKLSIGGQNGGATAAASGTVELDVKAPIPLPGGASADASGSLQLHPAVNFAYHGAKLGSPRTASIGFDLGAHAQWKISGELARSTGSAPVRLPFAQLHASPVLTVAGIPVVVNVGLTCFLEVSADGKVTVDTEQEVTGSWSVHADYTGGRGWSPVSNASDTKVSPVRLRLAGKAGVRAGLGAEVSVGLYDAVGVEATLEPYLRAQVDGSLTVDTAGNPPKVPGSWALYGGIDLTGALLAHLKIFGTPIIEGKLPLPGYHHEWPIPLGR
ncbi:hypothetical protein GCM10010193_40420 [Kitasatospora atroaurantiaca]|uniref:Lipoprotein n=1 Tax=Kitasatospora atroaurantiaca TaxID=285545 RepID=A0A561F1J1_9ACTN|nr:hypothetical protein [Kitasatospora atroaurantiaca]TWE21724.1 hypothetical protein FB465_6929 [Kitasatospora atroaurantiaca]